MTSGNTTIIIVDKVWCRVINYYSLNLIYYFAWLEMWIFYYCKFSKWIYAKTNEPFGDAIVNFLPILMQFYRSVVKHQGNFDGHKIGTVGYLRLCYEPLYSWSDTCSSRTITLPSIAVLEHLTIQETCDIFPPIVRSQIDPQIILFVSQFYYYGLTSLLKPQTVWHSASTKKKLL